jgi:nucleotide-binding universal stress UspA family protein
MYEVSRILVPTDFSRCADHALDHAVLLAERLEAGIALLHVDESLVLTLAGLQCPEAEAHRAKVKAFSEEKFLLLRDKATGHAIMLETMTAEGRAHKVIDRTHFHDSVPRNGFHLLKTKEHSAP